MKRATLLVMCAAAILGTSPGVCAFKYVMKGMDAPDGLVHDLDGRSVAVSDLNGETGTIVIFWALWSQRSREQLLDLAMLYDSLQTAGIAVVAVSVDKQRFDGSLIASIRAYVDAQALPFPTYLDPGLKLFYAYGVVAVPSTAVVDPARRVVYELAGYSPYAADTMHRTTLATLGLLTDMDLPAVALHIPRGAAARYFRLGRKLFQRGDMTTAGHYFAKSVQDDSSFAPAHYYSGLTAAADQKSTAARASLSRACAADPQNPVYRLATAEFLATQGDTTGAVASAHEALRLDSTYIGGRALLAKIALNRGDLTRARREIDLGLAIDPQSLQLERLSAEHLVQSGDTTAALVSFRAILSRLIGDNH